MTASIGPGPLNCVAVCGEGTNPLVTVFITDRFGGGVFVHALRSDWPALHAAITEALTPQLNAEMLAKLEAEEQTTWSVLPVPNAGTEAPRIDAAALLDEAAEILDRDTSEPGETE